MTTHLPLTLRVCRFPVALYLLFAVAPTRAPAAVQTVLSFDAPQVVIGSPGSKISFDAFCVLSTTANDKPDGAQGWTLSLTVNGGTLKSIDVSGVTVATIFDEDGKPETPPVAPYLFDLANAAYQAQELSKHSEDQSAGAISAVVLQYERKMVLEPLGKARVARVTVETTLPPGAGETAVTLRYRDGFLAKGRPVQNRVVIDGLSIVPNLETATVAVAPPPPKNLRQPGDLNQDKALDVSDPVFLLNVLFLGRGTDLPCGDGTVDVPVNRTLADANGDVIVDVSDVVHLLNYLFFAGAPHTLGLECVEVEGCAGLCG